MIELVDKDIKAVITVFHMFKKVEERLRMWTRYKIFFKDPIWTSRDENI